MSARAPAESAEAPAEAQAHALGAPDESGEAAVAAGAHPPLPEDEDEGESDSFAAHKRELRLGMRHRDSFAVHASHLTGTALEHAIVAVNAAGAGGAAAVKKRLSHQDSMAVLRRKHEGQLDRLSQPMAAAPPLHGRRVSRDDSTLRDAPTSPEMHAQARGAEGAHELGAAAHAGRLADAVRRSAASAGPTTGEPPDAADASGAADAEVADEDGSDDSDDGDGGGAPSAGGGAASGVVQAPGPPSAGGAASSSQKKKKSRLRSMAKGVGSFLGLRKSKKKRQKELEAAAATTGAPPVAGALFRSSSAPEMQAPAQEGRPGVVVPSSPPPRVAGSRSAGVGAFSPAASADVVGPSASPVRGILKSPVRKATSPAAAAALSPASPGGPASRRRISFADQHGATLANVRYCEDLHYSAIADHSAADYGEGGKCAVM